MSPRLGTTSRRPRRPGRRADRPWPRRRIVARIRLGRSSADAQADVRQRWPPPGLDGRPATSGSGPDRHDERHRCRPRTRCNPRAVDGVAAARGIDRRCRRRCRHAASVKNSSSARDGDELGRGCRWPRLRRAGERLDLQWASVRARRGASPRRPRRRRVPGGGSVPTTSPAATSRPTSPFSTATASPRRGARCASGVSFRDVRHGDAASPGPSRTTSRRRRRAPRAGRRARRASALRRRRLVAARRRRRVVGVADRGCRAGDRRSASTCGDSPVAAVASSA